MGNLWSCFHDSTTVYLHHQDFNETLGEKVRCCMLLWINPGSHTLKKQKLYSHLPLTSQIIQIKWARHIGTAGEVKGNS